MYTCKDIYIYNYIYNYIYCHDSHPGHIRQGGRRPNPFQQSPAKKIDGEHQKTNKPPNRIEHMLEHFGNIFKDNMYIYIYDGIIFKKKHFFWNSSYYFIKKV